MKDIYGEDYLIISRYDFNKLQDRIVELERQNKEMHDWICTQAKKVHDSVGDTLKFVLRAR